MDSTLIVEIVAAVLAVGALGFFFAKRNNGNASVIPDRVTPKVSTNHVVDKEDDVNAANLGASVDAVPVTQGTQVVPVLLESPESLEVRSTRLRERLGKSQSSIADAFRKVFAGSIDNDSAWEELEDTLIMADLGARTAAGVVDSLKVATRKAGAGADLKNVVRESLVALVDGGFSRDLATSRHENRPAIVLTVGVNGTGKTTTTGKLARLLVSQDKDVLLGAADTFRAAAANQLETWGERVGAPVVRGPEGGDPASVAFDAVNTGIEHEVDVVLIDTAGRLHTKQGLMDELGKVHRVAAKAGGVDEVLLVIDATTGQNGLAQARVFSEVVPVTGIVLTKLDGTAKGGIVVAVQEEIGVPVKLVGLGEGPDDLAVFDPSSFVEGLIG